MATLADRFIALEAQTYIFPVSYTHLDVYKRQILTQCGYALTHEKESRNALLAIQQQAQRMSGLVNQLLFLSRADRGTQALHTEPVDLSELMEATAQEMSAKAESAGIRVLTDIEPSIFVTADELLLMRMLINLAENAIRFGRSGGFVKFTLHTEDGQVHGTVEDDGIGIAPADLPHIWERFYQAEMCIRDSSRAKRRPPAPCPACFGRLSFLLP